jgi:hypothetical protein
VPSRSKVKGLPEEIRKALDSRLKLSGFGDYLELSAWLSDQGYEISKSCLQRYGKALEQQIQEIEAAREEAQAIVEACPDEANAIELATTKLIAHKLYQGVKNLSEDGEIDITKAARAISDLNRSSISLQKYRGEVKAKAELAAGEVEKKAKAGGLSSEAITEIKNKILGIGG